MNLWVKMWPLKIFFGTLRVQCDLKERGLWYEMIFLAKLCRVAESFPPEEEVHEEHVEKLISLNETTPYPRQYFAEFFGVDLDWLEKTLTKFKEQHRIREDKRGIWIIKWEEHQGEYDRQKMYRQGKAPLPSREKGEKKKETFPTAPVCKDCKTKEFMEPVRDKKGITWKCGNCGGVYIHEGNKWVKEKNPSEQASESITAPKFDALKKICHGAPMRKVELSPGRFGYRCDECSTLVVTQNKTKTERGKDNAKN